ncbi:MAG: hypothetical protein NUV52_02025 [Candidatus Roizmanbacteria bacterium]|nr:hypothetical protein [Candidatus Roizmanbacteria bacterium]
MNEINYTPLNLPTDKPPVPLGEPLGTPQPHHGSRTIPLLVSGFAFIGVFGYLIYYLSNQSFIPFTSKASTPTPTVAVYQMTTPSPAVTMAPKNTIEALEDELMTFESTMDADTADVKTPDISIDF